VAALAVLVTPTACGNSGEEKPPAANLASTAAASDALDLRGVCPGTIVVQTSWNPNVATFGGLYQALLGSNPAIDAGKKRVTAPLVVRGQDTGVKL